MASTSVRSHVFCHFLGLIQESNQRKSRKNNASARKKSTRTPLFFPPHAHGIFCLMIFRRRIFKPGITDLSFIKRVIGYS
jgi:hypothetical protein